MPDPLHRFHPAAAAVLLLVAVLVTLCASPPAVAQPPEDDDAIAEYVRANYSKREAMIPMRDGVKLFTSIYVPNDTAVDGSKTYPILLNRTPYGVDPYGADAYKEHLGPTGAYAKEGFIFVYQDVRGKTMSEGEFVNMRPHVEAKSGPGDVDESTDTYDTIEWLLANLEHHNGRVGLWGISYPGFYASAGAIDSHPALVAVSPQAPIADWFWDDMHHHGALILPLTFNFFSMFGQERPEPTAEPGVYFAHGTPDGYDFFLDLGPLSNVDAKYFKGDVEFWNQVAAHPNYDDFWQSRNILPHLENVSAAVMTVGGWYDAEDLYGPLNTYRAFERQNPGIENTLVMGPWPHGGWTRGDGRSLGDADFDFATGTWYVEHVELPFFRHHLKGEGELELPEALAFETGADRWRRFDDWPPEGLRPTRLHLRSGGALAFEAPAEDVSGDGGPAFDSYVSDPARPVPYTQKITTWWSRDYMTEDQRFAATRPDVLVYESEPLEEDLTIAGPITADLWVSTSGGDADWIVKVIDVYATDEPEWKDIPEGERPWRRRDADDRGTQRLVRAEVLRGRFRNGYETPEPFTPDQPTKVSFPLQDVLHTFKKGHRVMVHVQSTWFPLVDRNPGTWVDNIFEATEEDFIPVTNRVYRSPEMPSAVVVGVLEE